MTVVEGSNVSFSCSATANYAYWTVNTTHVHNGSRHQSYIFSQSVEECNYQSIGLVILTSGLLVNISIVMTAPVVIGGMQVQGQLV